jgi:hypothetical protein
MEFCFQILLNHQVFDATDAENHQPDNGGVGGVYNTWQSERYNRKPLDLAQIKPLVKLHGTEKNQIDHQSEY